MFCFKWDWGRLTASPLGPGTPLIPCGPRSPWGNTNESLINGKSQNYNFMSTVHSKNNLVSPVLLLAQFHRWSLFGQDHPENVDFIQRYVGVMWQKILFETMILLLTGLPWIPRGPTSPDFPRGPCAKPFQHIALRYWTTHHFPSTISPLLMTVGMWPVDQLRNS